MLKCDVKASVQYLEKTKPLNMFYVNVEPSPNNLK